MDICKDFIQTFLTADRKTRNLNRANNWPSETMITTATAPSSFHTGSGEAHDNAIILHKSTRENRRHGVRPIEISRVRFILKFLSLVTAEVFSVGYLATEFSPVINTPFAS